MAYDKKFTGGTPKYDWGRNAFVEDRNGITHRIEKDRRWEMLIYSGRVPHADIDPGIVYSPEVLKALLEKGKLTGRALEDAKTLT